MNHQTRLDSLARRLDMILAKWPAAWDAARERRADGMASPSLEPGGRSSTTSSVVERTALANLDHGDTLIDRLESELRQVESAIGRLATDVLRAAPPKARNTKDGRVVIDCANPHGCPTGSTAKREGLCSSCWAFADTNDRHRLIVDVELARQNQRAATRDRVASHRSKKVLAKDV